MNDESYKDAILKFLAERKGRRIRVRKLARQMGIPDGEYGDFRWAYKALRDSGRLMLGSKSALTLPSPAATLVGRFVKNQRGFGFVVPEEPDAKGDLFVPPDKTGGAMTGDLVVARVLRRGNQRRGRAHSGEVIEIRERGTTRCVGTLERAEGTWFVIPDGKSTRAPIVVRDVPEPERASGLKVVVEIVEYGDGSDLPAGVIVETLGRCGAPEVELKAVMRAYGLAERFPDEVLDDAGSAAREFDPDRAADREDLTGLTVITIDPDTARDYDDAISLERNRNGTVTLGTKVGAAMITAYDFTLDGQTTIRHIQVEVVAPEEPQAVWLPWEES